MLTKTLRFAPLLSLRVNVPKFSADQNQAAEKNLASAAISRL